MNSMGRFHRNTSCFFNADFNITSTYICVPHEEYSSQILEKLILFILSTILFLHGISVTVTTSVV
jgi:hypothetical protein